MRRKDLRWRAGVPHHAQNGGLHRGALALSVTVLTLALLLLTGSRTVMAGGSNTPQFQVGAADQQLAEPPLPLNEASTGENGADSGQMVALTQDMRPPSIRLAADHFFPETGFSIDEPAFFDYFQSRGGVGTFGFPVSNTFRLMGFPVQIFQRQVLQLFPDNSVHSLNLLDPGLMPYTNINGSQFPAVDPLVKDATPVVGSPTYAQDVVTFIQQHAPNQIGGTNVGFFDTFNNTVTLQDAFPMGGGNPALLTLLNLEIWGTPTSNPTADPTNANFIYLRFQRGIMHFHGNDPAGNPITEGILLADWFKSMMTGVNLPADLAAQAMADNSPFLLQYDPTMPNWVHNPVTLPDSDLTGAFQPHLPMP